METVDTRFLPRLLKFFKKRDVKTITSQKRARKIMKANYFGIEEAIKYFKFKPTEQQGIILQYVPFSEKTLKECKNTHILIAVFPISILELYSNPYNAPISITGYYKSPDSCLADAESPSFIKEKGTVSWQLVRKTPIKNSISKTWQDQQKHLSKKDIVPNARVMVYTIWGHYLATGRKLRTIWGRVFRPGEMLFWTPSKDKEIFVRCSDTISDNRHVIVGRFHHTGMGEYGFDVIYLSDDAETYVCGLAAARKFD